MKKSTKILWVLFVIGFIGAVTTAGYTVGSGKLISRQAAKTYPLSEEITGITMDILKARVEFIPEDGRPYAEFYAKAWLPEEINPDERIAITFNDGALHLTEIPFENEFLGFFPQPYEMTITLHVSEKLCERYEDMSEGRA